MFGRRQKDNSRQARVPGSRGRNVFSYNSNLSIKKTEQKRGEDPRIKPTYARTPFWERVWVRNMPSLIALGAVTLSVLYCLGLSTNPKIVVSANSPQSIVLRDKEDYQLGAQKILSSNLLNHTKFTVNTGGFEKAFREEFPEVDDVSLALPIVSRRPIVTVSIAEPQMILTAGGKAWVLDKRGTVIMQASDLSKQVRDSLPVVQDQSGLEVSAGKTVLPTEDVTFIAEVIAQLKAKQIKPESITLPKAAHEVDIKPVGQPYTIKFSVDTSAREAAGAYLAVKQNLEASQTAPAQYIDVRVPGRAYYQ